MALKTKNTIPNITKEVQRLNKELPLEVGNIAKNHFILGFSRDGGQTDDSSGGWAQRKKEDKTYRREGSKRNILVKTGALRNSIDVQKATFSQIVISTGSEVDDYASVHNSGGKYTPRREFMGDSGILNRKIVGYIKKRIDKRLRK